MLKLPIKQNPTDQNKARSLVNMVLSFNKGLGGGRPMADVVNGLYLAVQFTGLGVPCEFRNGDPSGVSCPVIRRVLAFEHNMHEHDDAEAEAAGMMLREHTSRQLGLMAQYRFSGDVHLFPDEAETARTLLDCIMN